MKLFYRNHIALINYQRFLEEKSLTEKMLTRLGKVRDIWISGQNL